MLNKSFFKTIILPLLIIASGTKAATTNIYCVDLSNPSGWYWAKNRYNSYITVNGEWHTATYLPNETLIFDYFLLSSTEYNRVKQYCPANHVIQPADNRFSNWSIFVTQDNNQLLTAQKGVLVASELSPRNIEYPVFLYHTVSQPSSELTNHINVRLPATPSHNNNDDTRVTRYPSSSGTLDSLGDGNIL